MRMHLFRQLPALAAMVACSACATEPEPSLDLEGRWMGDGYDNDTADEWVFDIIDNDGTLSGGYRNTEETTGHVYENNITGVYAHPEVTMEFVVVIEDYGVTCDYSGAVADGDIKGRILCTFMRDTIYSSEVVLVRQD